MSERFSSQLRSAKRQQPAAGDEQDVPQDVGSSSTPPKPPGPSAAGGRRPVVAIAAAIVLAVVLGTVAFFGFGGSDSVSDADIASRQQQYQTLVAGPGLPLELVRADQVDASIVSMPITQEQRTELREQVASGETRLAWITLWDTHAEDGDILRFESDAAFPVEVKALNAPTTLAIPLPASGTVKVTGVVDGGGGITIALKSGAAEIAWPTMQPGDSLDLPVRAGP